jgi:hypothetical protein
MAVACSEPATPSAPGPGAGAGAGGTSKGSGGSDATGGTPDPTTSGAGGSADAPTTNASSSSSGSGGQGGAGGAGGVGGGGAATGDCCVATTTPGCAADPATEQCVCALYQSCCIKSWDEICAALADAHCGACEPSEPGAGGGYGGKDGQIPAEIPCVQCLVTTCGLGCFTTESCSIVEVVFALACVAGPCASVCGG